MKIQITGNKCDAKLALVKWVKDITGLGLKESKDLCDEFLNEKKPLIIDTIKSYSEVEQSFFDSNFNSTLTLKKYRVELIDNFLRKHDPEWSVKSDKEYEKYFELFEYLFRTDKENLKNTLNDAVDNLKHKLNDFKIK